MKIKKLFVERRLKYVESLIKAGSIGPLLERIGDIVKGTAAGEYGPEGRNWKTSTERMILKTDLLLLLSLAGAHLDTSAKYYKDDRAFIRKIYKVRTKLIKISTEELDALFASPIPEYPLKQKAKK